MTSRRNATKTAAPKRAPRRAAASRTTMSVTLPVNEMLPALLRSFSVDFATGGWTTLAGKGLRDVEELDDPYQRESFLIACVNLHLLTVSGIRMRIYDRDPFTVFHIIDRHIGNHR